MFEPLGTPLFLADARKNGKGRSPVREILIFFVLTMIAQLAQGFLMMPYQLIYILTDKGFFEVAASGDMNAAMEYSTALTLKMTGEPWYAVFMLLSTAAVIFAVWIYCCKMQGQSYLSLGLTRRPYKEYAIGLLLGLVAFAATLGFSLAFGSVSFAGISDNANAFFVIALLLGYAVQGFSEEILCRGYLMVALGRSMPLWMAVVASSFAFAALHMGNAGYTLLGFLNIFLFGVLMSLYMIRRGNIWGAAALHTAWNFAEGVLTDSFVSGMKMPVSLLSFSLKEGDELINGGAFGPEGGIAATCVLAVGIVLLLMMRSKNNAPSAITEEK